MRQVFTFLQRGRSGLLHTAPVVFRHQGPGHRDFMNRIFGERHPDGITNAVFQQRADAHSRFHPAVFAIAGFGDAQVQRIGHAQFIHPRAQQPVGLNHHLRVG